MAGAIRRRISGKRPASLALQQTEKSFRAEATVSSDLSDGAPYVQHPAVVVICRGARFETTRRTLVSLGACYLSLQSEIQTAEPISLDYSPEAFRVLLDALTVAQLDLGKALLHVARNRPVVVDLEALLEFVLLGWVLGVSLPMPPPPGHATPRGDKFGEFRTGFNLRSAYQGESGVFHHLLGSSLHGQTPCRYNQCIAPAFLLGEFEEYEEPLDVSCPGCMPVSIEVDTLMTGRRGRRNEWSDEFLEWGDANTRISSIHMLQVPRKHMSDELHGDIITMHAGSCAVFDLGPRRALLCEGLVLGMNRTTANTPGEHLDMLTVDMVSELDRGTCKTRLACQPLDFDEDLITYFRLSFAVEPQCQGGSVNHCPGRLFRLRIDPFHPKFGDYKMHDHLCKPLYMLRSVELFGTLFEVPEELCHEDQLREPFVFEEGITRIKKRGRHGIVNLL